MRDEMTAKKLDLSTDGQPVKRRPGRPRLLEPSADYVARREEIVSAAAQVFREKGYDAGTLDDVADALQLRRASLYYYVRSKANLLYMIFERAVDLAFAEFQHIREIEDPTKRLEALIRFHVRMATDEPSLFTVVYDYRHRLEPQYEETVRTREAEYLKVYRETVEAAGAAGVIDVVDPLYVTNALFGMTTWAYKWFQPDRDDAERLADACVALILRPTRKRRQTPTTPTPRRRTLPTK
jgi:AcrR family transcriptional regulator